MWSLNLQLKCNTLQLNGIGNTSAPLHHAITLDHVIVHCLYIDHFVCIVCYRIEVELEPEITPFVEDPVIVSRQQGKQPPPLIMSIKSHFPLIPLCMIRMLPCIVSCRIVEPISFAWPIILSQ